MGKHTVKKLYFSTKGKSTLKMKVKVKFLSRVPLFATPWAVAYQASSVHGILQARILEWVAISFSSGSSWSRDQNQVSRIVGRCFNLWATREAQKLTLVLSKTP